MDDQHKAVRGATEELHMSRHLTRNDEAQQAYLHDLEALAAEVLLAMREAGIDQGALVEAARSIDDNPVTRTIADLSEDNLELLVREAFASRRGLIQVS